jgi:hypothetical protein
MKAFESFFVPGVHWKRFMNLENDLAKGRSDWSSIPPPRA